MKTICACVTMILSLLLCGCKQHTPSGGVQDRTDPNAPKEIVSKNIVSFSTWFVVSDRYELDKSGMYEIEIADNEQGEHVLKVSGHYKYEMVVEDRVLVDVQALIDTYDLVKKNGGGRIVAGLPAEFEPWQMDAVYDSGERLHFYETGEPDADWAKAFRDYFTDLIAADGCQEAVPSREAVTLTAFQVSFDWDDDSHTYELTMDEGKNTLYHKRSLLDNPEDHETQIIDVDDEFVRGLASVIAQNRIDCLEAPVSLVNPPQVNESSFLTIYLEYENGRFVNYEYEANQLPQEWPTMKEALYTYLTGVLM